MLDSVELRKPHKYPFTVRLFDRLMDTHGIDAPRSLGVLIGEIDSKGERPERLRKLAVGWAAANRTYQEQFTDKSTERILASFAQPVEDAEAALRETLGVTPHNLETAEGMMKLVDALDKANVLPQHEMHSLGMFLTEDTVKAFLRASPPRRLLEGSPYRTIDEALNHHDGLTLVSLARKSGDEVWLGEQEKFFRRVKASDFEERAIRITAIDRQEFPSVTQSLDGVSWGDKATGVIVLRTLPPADVQRKAALLFGASRLIHYVHEVYSFGNIFSSLFDGHIPESGMTSHLPALFWKGMRKRTDADPHFFGVHALLEEVYWQKTFGNLATVFSEYSPLFRADFPAVDRLIQAKGPDGSEQIIGGHPISLIFQFFEGKVRENSTTKRGIRLHFLMELLGKNDLKEIEIMLLGHLKEGYIGLTTQT